MFDEELRATWRRGDGAVPTRPRPELEELLRPAARRTERTLGGVLATYVALLGAAAVLALSNVRLYRENEVMLAVELVLALVASVLAAFGVRLWVRLWDSARADRPLLETVERRLAWYERGFEPWLVAAAFAPWLVTLAINTWIDEEQGTYHVHQPLGFAAVSALMVGLTYVLLRISLAPTAKELALTLHDLRADALEATPSLGALRRRTRVWMALGVVLLVLGVAAGSILWWQASP
ncbi:MAG: hypothetical protein L6Q99_18075 [Planctomycetes bacterium]|nr:hypothetical protein [Planctomycetota bacterium]